MSVKEKAQQARKEKKTEAKMLKLSKRALKRMQDNRKPSLLELVALPGTNLSAADLLDHGKYGLTKEGRVVLSDDPLALSREALEQLVRDGAWEEPEPEPLTFKTLERETIK